MKLEFIQANRVEGGDVAAFFSVRCEPGKWDRFSSEVNKCFAPDGTIDQARFQRAFLEFLGAGKADQKAAGAIVEIVSDKDFANLFAKKGR